MSIGKNTEVTLQFTMEDEDGEILNDIYEHTPYRFVYGTVPRDQYPGLEQGVEGMGPEDSIRFVVSAKNAFGERDKALVEKIRSNELPQGAVIVGNLVRKISDNGTASQPYTVIGFIGDWVYLDQNHPWAGKDIHYTVRVISVKSIPENIKMGKPRHD